MTTQEAINAVHEISSNTPHNGYMRSSDTIELVYRILRDHETQLKLASDVYSTDKMHMYQELKAKDEEIAKYQMAIDKQSKRAEALKQLSLDKDNEIATAKMRHKLEHDRYLITEAIIKEKDEEIERLEKALVSALKRMVRK